MTVTLPAGASVTRTLRQRVPGSAPAGQYTYAVNVGTFGGAVTASDAFPFTKEAGLAARGAGSDADWSASGWEETATTASAELPGAFALSEASPNPFASSARLTLDVPEAQRVTVAAYDALGRRVAVLHDGALEAGPHVLTFDGSSLPAGVYVVRATGERGVSAVRRVSVLR
jgi:hypothetical protein